MSSQDLTPAPFPFYAETGKEEVRVAPVAAGQERYWIYVLLFLITLGTTTVVGTFMQVDFDRNLPFDVATHLSQYSWLLHNPAELLRGLPFALTLLLILLAHEFGHYCAAVYHGVDSSLPYFLPSPFLGTFGAFIRVRSPIYSKRVLFDIGISGPLAGFVFLLPALAIGLAFSKVIPGIAHQGDLIFGVPALQLGLERIIFPGIGSANIYLHPVARAAWVGMLATSMNLLPVGQLDGGHIVYAFLMRRHRIISTAICIVMLPLGYFFWYGWSFWGLILLFLGRRHPMVYDTTELTPGRRVLGWVALAVFLLCFIMVPTTAGSL